MLKQARVVPFYPRGKTNWEGPYYVQKMIPRGAVKLADWDGNEFVEPVRLAHVEEIASSLRRRLTLGRCGMEGISWR